MEGCGGISNEDANLDSKQWQVRLRQIETILNRVVDHAAISAEPGVGYGCGADLTVVRDRHGIELRISTELSLNDLDDVTAHAQLLGLGWSWTTEPDAEYFPDYDPPELVIGFYSRHLPTDADLGAAALTIARAFVVLHAGPSQIWNVSPEEFGDEAAGLRPVPFILLGTLPDSRVEGAPTDSVRLEAR